MLSSAPFDRELPSVRGHQITSPKKKQQGLKKEQEQQRQLEKEQQDQAKHWLSFYERLLRQESHLTKDLEESIRDHQNLLNLRIDQRSPMKSLQHRQGDQMKRDLESQTRLVSTAMKKYSNLIHDLESVCMLIQNKPSDKLEMRKSEIVHDIGKLLTTVNQTLSAIKTKQISDWIQLQNEGNALEHSINVLSSFHIEPRFSPCKEPSSGGESKLRRSVSSKSSSPVKKAPEFKLLPSTLKADSVLNADERACLLEKLDALKSASSDDRSPVKHQFLRKRASLSRINSGSRLPLG